MISDGKFTYEYSAGGVPLPDNINLIPSCNNPIMPYIYVSDNPLIYTDNLGLSPSDWYDPRFYYKFHKNALGGLLDFLRNYRNMRNANTIGADKYFHCLANCEASRRGFGGGEIAALVSELRELTDEHLKGDSRKACDEDRVANKAGRGRTGSNCKEACKFLRPSWLDPRW